MRVKANTVTVIQSAVVRGERADQTEISHALKLLVTSGEVTELRVLNTSGKGTVSGYFDDLDALTREAASWSGRASGIYMTVNPVQPALLARAANRAVPFAKATTADDQIERRRWFLVDLDPVRPSGIAATDAEHAAALDRARSTRETLSKQGWPEPLLVDTGNGAYLLYRVDLPNDPAAQHCIKLCLEVLDLNWSDNAVKVDTTVGNAARLMRIPGTLNAKGDQIPERPHRMARILERLDQPEVVPYPSLAALAETAPSKPKQATSRHPEGFDVGRWLQERGLPVVTHAPWGSGGQKWVMATCPWNTEHQNRSAYIVQFSDGAISAGCHHDSCQSKGWHDLRDLYDPPWRDGGDSGDSGRSTEDDRIWTPPMPLEEHAVPPFPTHVFAKWLQQWVEAEAEATQTPADLAGMLVLAVIAAACAKRIEVRVRDGWTEPVNIYTVTVLESGNRKSAVFRSATGPLEEYERAETRRLAPEIIQAKSRHNIAERQIQKAEADASKASADDRGPLLAEAERLVRELAETEPPKLPRLISDDCSPERLSGLLAEQGGRMAVLSPEGDVFALMGGRYSPNSSPNFAVFLKGHAGDTLRVDRMSRTEFVHRPALTLGLTVQPDVMRGLAQKPAFRGQGLLARFLYSLPPSLVGRRRVDSSPVPGYVQSAYETNVSYLLSLTQATDEAGDPAPCVLRLTPEAHRLLEQFATEVEPRLSEFGDLGAIRDWGGKLVGAVARLAALLHMIEHAAAATSWQVLIDGSTMASAIALGGYLTAHAKKAFAMIGSDAVVQDANILLRWIEVRGLVRFTKRDGWQARKNHFRRAQDLDAPLELLAEHGYIRRQLTLERKGRGQQPSPCYEVNPLWVHHNSQNPQNSHVERATKDSLTAKPREWNQNTGTYAAADLAWEEEF